MTSRQGLPSNPRAGRSTTSRLAQRLKHTDSKREYTETNDQSSRTKPDNYDEGYDAAASYIPPSRESSYQKRWMTPSVAQVQSFRQPASSSEGSAVWNKVVGVANNLTISVSQAWASNITKLSGEETPPGGESRLTRAMKAYHLQKATSPTDLPDWLFDERDRRARSAKFQDFTSTKVTKPVTSQLPSNDQPYNQRGLRDIYDAAASTQVTNRTANHDRTPSKATDRLKALRDAKKGVRRNLSEDVGRNRVEEEPTIERETRRNHDLDDQSNSNPPKRRIGLPSGPRRF